MPARDSMGRFVKGGFQIRQTMDTVTPDLERKIAALSGGARIMKAIGTQIVGLTKRAFRDESLRQIPWPPKKKDGSPSNLIRKGALLSSIRITGLTQNTVTVGTDRPYGAVHQLGSSKKTGRGSGIPPRPYFPFKPDGTLADVAREPVQAIVQKATDDALGM